MEYLIPQHWFEDLGQPLLLLIFLLALAVVIKGADWLVEGLANIAYRLGISKIVVAATVLSLGTTSPETAVSVTAAWAGESGLALGNAVGSIIADTALIFGLGCVITILPADRYVLMRQGWMQLGCGVLLALLCYAAWFFQGPEAALQRWVGVLFLGLLVVYIWLSIRWGKRHPQAEPFMPAEEVAPPLPTIGYPLLILMSVGGLALVIFGSHVLIQSVEVLAKKHWGVPTVVVAATIVALGTSLPELIIGMTSLVKGHKEVLVGNVIGADILNVLWVTGAAAIAAPLPLMDPMANPPNIFLLLHLPAMLVVLVLFRVFIARSMKSGKFRRWYGWPLLGIYVVYVVTQFVLSAGATVRG